MSDPSASPPGPRPVDDDGYFEELTRSVFQSGLSWQLIDAKWPGFRRAFSNFSIADVADYLPDDVDRLMSDPEIVRSLGKIEATIENAAEMLMIQFEHGSFERYCASFASEAALVEDISRRFKQIGLPSAASFVQRVSGPASTVA